MPDMTANQGMPDWTNLLGGAGALIGNMGVAGAQNNSSGMAQQFAQNTGNFGPVSGYTPGGLGGSMQKGNLNLNFGNFNSPYNQLPGVAGNAFGTAGGIGAPSGLNSGLSGAFGQAGNGLSGFNPGGAGFAANSDFLGAGNLANSAGQGASTMAQNQYAALQALQAPGNQQAMNMFQNSVFGNGQIGSTAGNTALQNFGKGLGLQNAQDAASAQGLGLQALGTANQGAYMLGNTGQNLLSSAFNNFGNTSMLAPNVMGAYMNPGLAAIGGAGQLNQQANANVGLGLQGSLGYNQAQARAGALSTTNANSFNQQSPYGQLLGGLFGGMATGPGGAGGSNPMSMINSGRNIYNQLSGLFGGGAPSTAMMPGGGGYGMLSDAFGGGGVGAGSVLSGGADMSGIGSAGAGGMFDYSSMLGGGAGDMATAGQGASDLASAFGGFNSAGGAAADLGAGTAAGAGEGAAVGAAGAEGAGAASSGLTLSAGAAALPAAAMLAIAAHQPGVSFNKNWWDTMNKTLAAGPGSNAGPMSGLGYLQGIKQNTQYNGALSSLNQDYGNGNAAGGVNLMPGGESQYLASLGIQPQSTANMPAAGAAGSALAAFLGIPNTSQTSRQKM